MPDRDRVGQADKGRGRNYFILGLLLLGMLLQLLLPAVALADPAVPTNLQLETVRAFHHVAEADDMLVVFHYNIHYATGQPSYPASSIFVFRLLNTDGVTYLAATVPYPYNNSGYDYGLAAFYFPAATAPTWGNAYVVKISGSPEYYASPPVVSRTMVTSDYCALTTAAEQRVALGNYIIDVARQLETNWSTTLVYSSDLGTVLNTTGEAYLRGAIPGIQTMAPQIFATQTAAPGYTERTWTTAEASAYESQFAGTPIQNAVEQVATDLRVKWNVITGILVLIIMGVFAAIDQLQFGTVKPSLIEGTIILVGAVRLGWFAAAILGIITVFFAFFIGYVWFFRHG